MAYVIFHDPQGEKRKRKREGQKERERERERERDIKKSNSVKKRHLAPNSHYFFKGENTTVFSGFLIIRGT